MQFTAKELARIVKGTVEGDENTRVWKPCKIEEGCEGGITFLGNPKYTHYIYEQQSSIVIVRRDFVPEKPVGSTLIRVDNPYMAVAVLLSLLVVLVFILPLTLHKVEENLEIFLFGCGVLAASISRTWNGTLVLTALEDPIRITLAVLAAGLLFRRFNTHLQKLTHKAVKTIGLQWTLFSVVLLLGLTSSLITAIIAALVLAEVTVLLPLPRKERTQFAVLACYAIGMGAVLTAIGEPLGTVVISK